MIILDYFTMVCTFFIYNIVFIATSFQHFPQQHQLFIDVVFCICCLFITCNFISLIGRRLRAQARLIHEERKAGVEEIEYWEKITRCEILSQLIEDDPGIDEELYDVDQKTDSDSEVVLPYMPVPGHGPVPAAAPTKPVKPEKKGSAEPTQATQENQTITKNVEVESDIQGTEEDKNETTTSEKVDKTQPDEVSKQFYVIGVPYFP